VSSVEVEVEASKPVEGEKMDDLIVMVSSGSDEPLAEHAVSVDDHDRKRFLAELEDWLGEWP
jgi:hypothetical protein